MRTTISLDDGLLDQMRRRAAELQQSVSRVIEDSVREAFLRRDEPHRAPFVVRVFSGGETQAGVDLDDNAALLEHLDDDR